MTSVEVFAVDGIDEIGPGSDLAEIIASRVDLLSGDVVVITSKVVSKALGLSTGRDRLEVIEEGTARVVAERGATRIVRTHHGLTMAAAGVDASNVAVGDVIALPPDPDGEARRIRAALRRRSAAVVGVVISDTAGRAWRVGQTDIAIGCAGVLPYESFSGRSDDYGNPLAVTAPAVADEIAGVAELVAGKLGRRPVVVVRGVSRHLVPAEDGPGAAALVRPEDDDLFGLGAREAVVAAVEGASMRGFPAGSWVVDDVVAQAGLELEVAVDDTRVRVIAPRERAVEAGAAAERLRILAHAHRVAMTVQVDVTS